MMKGNKHKKTIIALALATLGERMAFLLLLLTAGLVFVRTLYRPERDLGAYWPPQHRTRVSHGNVAAQRQGARCRRRWS